MKYILSLSGGKDSIALLILLLKEKQRNPKDQQYPLDEVITCEMVGWEYDAIEPVIKRAEELCKASGVKFTKLKIEIEEKFKKYSWCGGVCRYGTSMKIDSLQKYYNENYPGELIIEYIGYARGEEQRINRFFKKTIKIYPLIEMGLTENDCLVLSYKNGFHWYDDGLELYDFIDRVSCKYCRNKNLKELKALHKSIPKYWEQLKQKQQETDRPFRKDYSLEELEEKWKEEGPR